jgi:integrase
MADIEAIRNKLVERKRVRDLAMFHLAIDSKLRVSDLIRLKIDSVTAGNRIRDRGSMVQKKTSQPTHFEIGERAQVAVREWLAVISHKTGYLFPIRQVAEQPLSIRQYARIVVRL